MLDLFTTLHAFLMTSWIIYPAAFAGVMVFFGIFFTMEHKVTWAACFLMTYITIVANVLEVLPEANMFAILLLTYLMMASFFGYAWLSNLLVYRRKLTDLEQLFSWLPLCAYMLVFSTFVWNTENTKQPATLSSMILDITFIFIIPPLSILAFRKWNRHHLGPTET